MLSWMSRAMGVFSPTLNEMMVRLTTQAISLLVLGILVPHAGKGLPR